jgi:hypothetical protein
MGRECNMYGMEAKCIELSWETQKRPLGKHRRVVGIILKWILKKQDGMAWTAFTWLRIGINGGLL